MGNAIRNNDYNVDVGESEASVDNDADANDADDDEQEESDDTQQYSKRTREQVINDRYILIQQKTRQEMEAEVRVERGIRIQEEVVEDTGVVSSVDNDDGDHVNEEKRRQEKEKEGDNMNTKNKQEKRREAKRSEEKRREAKRS